jgi:hypothetical protein
MHALLRPTTAIALLSIGHAFAPASAAAEAHHEGIAYSVPGGEIAYREEHWIRDEGQSQRRLVLYRCPDGTPFARKTVEGKAGSSMPDFEMVDGRNGYREGVRQRNGRREVFFQERADVPEKAGPLPPVQNAVIDAGFDAYVRNKWTELDNDYALRIPFLIPERLGYVDVKLAGTGSSVENGEAVRKLRMSLDAWYSFVAPTLILTYTEKDQRLRRFEGISNVRDTGGKNQRVRIEFPAAQTPARLGSDAAAALPLSKQCPGGRAGMGGSQ